MGATSPVRVDDELFASAKAVGAVMSRSAAQQIAHWARISRELEAGGRLHVVAIPVDLAVLRVRERVRHGGHDVPEQKVRQRYERLWAHVATAIAAGTDARCADSR